MLTPKRQIQKLLTRKKAILFDLDGTLYLGGTIIPGAKKLVQQLRDEQKNIFFFTNNSSRSEKDYIKKLRKMGFDAHLREVVMSTHTLISFLRRKKWNKIFLLGTPAMKRMLQSAGIRHTKSKPNAVVVGFDKTLTYEKLHEACKYVENGVPLVWTHPDIFCPTDKGREPDCGAIGALISQVTGKKPVAVMGKPDVSMLKEVVRRINCKRSEMVLIGDRMSTDYKMGKSFGIDTILVLSGETSRTDIRTMKGRKPSYVVSSVQSLLN